MVATVGKRTNAQCRIMNKCLTPNIIYEATVTNNTDIVEKIYFGLCETSFKEKHRNHISSFRLQSRNKDIELSKCLWELKNENKILFIDWRTLKKVYAKPRFNYCKLCLVEKLYINNSILLIFNVRESLDIKMACNMIFMSI